MRKRSIGNKGSILVISTLLIGSAVLRVVTSASTAFAEGEFADAFTTSAHQSRMSKPQADTDVGTLLRALQEREARVQQMETEIERRAKALDVAQTEVERRLEALQQAEEQLQSTLARASTAAEDDLVRLTSVYENMKPAEAAELFATMEPAFAAGFLARMRPDIAAEVLSGLEPQTAYSISAILAGRNANAPTN